MKKVLLLENQSDAEIMKQLAEKETKAISCYVTDKNIQIIQEFCNNKCEIIPILPNLSLYSRDMSEGGPIKAILKRFNKLNLINKTKFTLGYINPLIIIKVVKKDFAMATKILTELELLYCKQIFKFSRFIVSDELTDLALAFNNKNIFLNLYELIKKYKLRLFFKTYNSDYFLKLINQLALKNVQLITEE